jgi:multidrug resistance efflux pump
MNNTQNSNTPAAAPRGNTWLTSLVIISVIFGALAAFLYWFSVRGTVFIENSYLDAPIFSIAPSAAGSLNAVYVHAGDHVSPNTPVAQVGSETLYSKDEGTVTAAPKAIGSYYSAGQIVVSLVANSKMRVIGSIEENDGLELIAVGQPASFTVDAFPGKTYTGVVDEVGQVSADTGVIFSISDKRPTKKFNVYVRFEAGAYPELKSGMSAKITVKTAK